LFYIKEHYSSTLEVKQSKFIAHLVPYDLYEDILGQLKKQHPKARHFVTAWRYLNQFDQILEASSDDGEPKGTSGKPSLMVLQGKEMINVAVIVVRYFGGTKLGTGGLVRAYSDVVNLVIENSTKFLYKTQYTKTIQFNYSEIRFIEYECKRYDIDIIKKEFYENAIYTLKAPKDTIANFFRKLESNNFNFK